MTLKALNPVLTSEGLKKAFAADNDGLQLTISHVGFGRQAYTPIGNEAALQDEAVRVPIAGGKYVGDHMVEISTLLDHTEDFWVRELGFFLDDGTLFAVWSDPDTPLAHYTQGVPIAVAYLLAIEALPAGAITFTGDLSLSLTFASEFASMAAASIRTMHLLADARREIDQLKKETARQASADLTLTANQMRS